MDRFEKLCKKIIIYAGKKEIFRSDDLKMLNLHSLSAINDILCYIRNEYHIHISTQIYFRLKTINDLLNLIHEHNSLSDACEVSYNEIKEEWRQLMKR